MKTFFRPVDQEIVKSHIEKYKASKSRLEYANELLNLILADPLDIPVYVQVYLQVCKRDKKFREQFEHLIRDKIFEHPEIPKRNIYLTWTKTFYAELCLMSSADVSKFILTLAKELMYKSEGCTIVFMLIFWKVSMKLKQKSPKTYQQCLNYVKQIDLKVVRMVNDSFWDSNEDAVDDELKKMFIKKKIEDYKFKIDPLALDRMKYICKRAFGDDRDVKHDFIVSMTNLSDTMENRLVKVHLEHLTEVKFHTVDFELDIKHHNEFKTKATLEILDTMGKFYKYNLLSNDFIKRVLRHLMGTCDSQISYFFSLHLKGAIEEDIDASFKEHKRYIQHMATLHMPDDKR